MDPFAISLAVVSGICLGTGLLHLFIGLRRQGTDMRHFTFGLFAVAYSGAVLTGLLMYRATTLPQYLGADRWSGVFAGVTYIFLIWFVAVYTDVQPLPVLGLLTALFAALIAAHVSRPTLIHGEIMGITFATLPWGEQVAFLDAAESTWELVFFFTQLLTIAFLFYACIRQFRRGERGEALTLGVGLVLFVATIVFDILVESGAVDFVLASDFGFLPLAIVMSIRLSNDVIRTEEELARYRRELEARVEQRTSQLQRANEDLAALNRIVQTLASVTELPGALERVSETVANLFSAQHVYIVLPSAPEAGLQVMVGYQQGLGPVGATPLPAPLTETPSPSRTSRRCPWLAPCASLSPDRGSRAPCSYPWSCVALPLDSWPWRPMTVGGSLPRTRSAWLRPSPVTWPGRSRMLDCSIRPRPPPSARSGAESPATCTTR
jgi:hypothetical protein